MKNKLLIFAIALLLVACCNDQKETEIVGYNLEGSWVKPISGMEDQVEGIELKPDGSACSINMKTLLYKTWKRDSNLLILSVESIGNGLEFEITDTLTIDLLTQDSLVLSDKNSDYTVCYTRQK